MHWIDQFTKGSFSLYSGNTLGGFQPLDFFHFYGLWFDLWLERITQALDTLGAEKKSYGELRQLLPTPSNLRALIQKAIPAYIGKPVKRELYARYVNFIARMLCEACPSDPFGISRTPLHTKAEQRKLLEHTRWAAGTPDAARRLGRLLAAAGSLVHGLYNDVVTDFGWDTYGPYTHVKKGRETFTLLIRNFPDLQPESLWPKNMMSPIKNLEIRQLYARVKWRIGFVGCHTLLQRGDPISGLAHYAVYADDKKLTLKEIHMLTEELARKAETIYTRIRAKDFEELKAMVMLQECFQLKALFDAAGMDWTPTAEMKKRIAGKPLLKGLFPTDTLMTNLSTYKKAFGIARFAKEVLGCSPQYGTQRKSPTRVPHKKGRVA